MFSNSFSYYSSTTTYFPSPSSGNSRNNYISIPIESPPSINPSTTAAIKIQSSYRSHLARSLINTIKSVEKKASEIETELRRQETVDAIRRQDDPYQRVRLSETLMKLLLKLDSVKGFYPGIRELRRAAAKRIVGLQELVDEIAAVKEIDYCEKFEGVRFFPGSLEEIVEVATMARYCRCRSRRL